MIIKFRYCIVLIVIVLNHTNAHLQSKLSFGFEVKPKFGFLLAQRPEIANIPRSHTFAGELSFVIQTTGKKKWHKTYNYPTVGATIFGASVGNKVILGNFYGSYAFIEFPFFKKSSYELCAKLGSGLAYTSKVYDPLLNPKNALISSHVNTLICFGLKNKFTINRHQIILGIDLTHFSNGAYKVPNIGVNMPFISLGYGCKFKTNPTPTDTSFKQSLPFQKLLFGMSAVYSNKEMSPFGQGRLPVYGLSLFSRYFFRPKVGCEFSLDVISKQIILKYKPSIEKNQADLIQVGVYAGYLLPLDKLHFALGMGVNIYDKFQPENLFYHRIGMRYYLDNGIHLNVVLRSNWAKADFTEWGIGYTFNYRKK